jgi:hypothetical protein
MDVIGLGHFDGGKLRYYDTDSTGFTEAKTARAATGEGRQP